MAVPSNVVERIKRLEGAARHAAELKHADRALQAARQAAREDRATNRQFLLELCLEIFAWRDLVAKSAEGKRLWAQLGCGRLPLRGFWFWDGVPITPDNPLVAKTMVSLDGPYRHFLIEEWKNGQPYREVARPTSAHDLLEAVHPKFLEELLTFVSGPESWQPIIDELDRRLTRYNLG